MTHLSWRGWLLSGMAVASLAVQVPAAPHTWRSLVHPAQPDDALWAALAAVHLSLSLWVLLGLAATRMGLRVMRWFPAAIVAMSFVPTVASADDSSLDGLPYPDIPVGTVAAHEPYVVQPGDSLWTIVETLEGPFASPADHWARVQALHEANHDVIGDNADLIHPGDLLRVEP